jgi:hypothetical protein
MLWALLGIIIAGLWIWGQISEENRHNRFLDSMSDERRERYEREMRATPRSLWDQILWG